MRDTEQAIGSPRKPRRAEQVAARIARAAADEVASEVVEGVQPLNPGFFQLEAIRNRSAAKLKSAKTIEVKGR